MHQNSNELAGFWVGCILKLYSKDQEACSELHTEQLCSGLSI